MKTYQGRVTLVLDGRPYGTFTHGLTVKASTFAIASTRAVEVGMSREWTLPVRVSPEEWVMPAGAFGEKAGPS